MHTFLELSEHEYNLLFILLAIPTSTIQKSMYLNLYVLSRN